MLTHKRIIQYVVEGDRLSNTTETITNGGQFAFDDIVVHNATPASSEIEVSFAAARADMKSILISTGAAQIVVRTNANHSGAPADTVTVPANSSVVWNTNDPAGSNPFKTADVTSLFITNSSATLDTDVKIYVLLDVTP